MSWTFYTASGVAKTAEYIGSEFPIGTVVQTTGLTAPSGWKICDGSALSRTTYSDLYATIGTTYGSGNGSTTFNIPDASGKMIYVLSLATRMTTGTLAPATGDLTGTYPALEIASGAVGTPEIASGAVTTAKIADANVTADKLGSTLAGQLGVSQTGTSRTIPLTQTVCRVSRSTNLTNYSSGTSIVFNTTDVLKGNCTYNSSTGVITVNTAGIYLCTFKGYWYQNPVGSLLRLALTNSSGTPWVQSTVRSSDGNDNPMAVSATLNLQAGATISAMIYYTGSPTNYFLYGNATEDQTRSTLDVRWIDSV